LVETKSSACANPAEACAYPVVVIAVILSLTGLTKASTFCSDDDVLSDKYLDNSDTCVKNGDDDDDDGDDDMLPRTIKKYGEMEQLEGENSPPPRETEKKPEQGKTQNQPRLGFWLGLGFKLGLQLGFQLGFPRTVSSRFGTPRGVGKAESF